jgi:hypothetical protein
MKTRTRYLFVFIALFAALATVAATPTRNFRAHLSGRDQLPNPVDTEAQGHAIFRFSQDGETLYYKLIVANIEDVTMAHIHVAPAPGQIGPPALWLYPDAPPPLPIPDRSDGVLAERVVTADDLVGPLAGSTDFAGLRQAIAEGRAYVNVHTIAFPPGEIRGVIH